MGHEGTESEALNVAMLRPGGDLEKGKLKFQDYQRRQLVTADIKKRLRAIKQDLGLLPPEEQEENGHAGGNASDEDAIQLDSDAEDERRQREAEEVRKREAAERQQLIEAEEARKKAAREAKEAADRKKAQEAEAFAQKQREIDAAFEALFASTGAQDPNTPSTYQPTEEEYTAALSGLSAGVRTLLTQRNAVIVSYLDASAHPSAEAAHIYNEFNRPVVEHAVEGSDGELTLDSIPPAEDFDVSSLESLAAKVTATRQKYEAARITEDQMYARKVRYTELNADLTPVTHYDANKDGDVHSLSEAFTAAMKNYAEARTSYNAQATASSSQLLADNELAALALAAPMA